jgi:glycerophosphoryl diester phosphodiesterase
LVFGHRGGAGIAPENTMTAFDRGVALGVDGLELDVRLSKDGIVVVLHDPTVDRTTNLAGPVGRFTADELARADAAWHFRAAADATFRGQAIGVPTLGAVLRRFRDVRIIVELKENTRELARAVVDLLRAHDAEDRVCVGSFGRRALWEVRSMDRAVATSAAREEVRWALYRSWLRWPVTRASYDGFQVPERSGTTRVISKRFISAAHRGGLGVQVWTVDSIADGERLLAWDADALITDRPDVIVPLVRRVCI